jgi:hypothetical protein
LRREREAGATLRLLAAKYADGASSDLGRRCVQRLKRPSRARTARPARVIPSSTRGVLHRRRTQAGKMRTTRVSVFAPSTPGEPVVSFSRKDVRAAERAARALALGPRSGQDDDRLVLGVE